MDNHVVRLGGANPREIDMLEVESVGYCIGHNFISDHLTINFDDGSEWEWYCADLSEIMANYDRMQRKVLTYKEKAPHKENRGLRAFAEELIMPSPLVNALAAAAAFIAIFYAMGLLASDFIRGG